MQWSRDTLVITYMSSFTRAVQSQTVSKLGVFIVFQHPIQLMNNPYLLELLPGLRWSSLAVKHCSTNHHVMHWYTSYHRRKLGWKSGGPYPFISFTLPFFLPPPLEQGFGGNTPEIFWFILCLERSWRREKMSSPSPQGSSENPITETMDEVPGYRRLGALAPSLRP